MAGLRDVSRPKSLIVSSYCVVLQLELSYALGQFFSAKLVLLICLVLP